MKRYDPATTPPADEWLATAEAERIVLVDAFHRREREKLPSPTFHATIHVVVENQIALGETVVIDTLTRLQDEGLSRHESVHAIGTILAEQIFGLLKGETPPGSDSNRRYLDRLRRLTADEWRNSDDDGHAG